jgi:hypothetical protein
MDIKILSYYNAINFIPDKNTYAVRIFNTRFPLEKKKPLVSSPLYLSVSEYTFDEEPLEEYLQNPDEFKEIGYTPFTKDIARKMIRDFLPYKDKSEVFLAHCVAGMCRSPSIGMAFNEIFKWGHKPEEISEVYRRRLKEYGVRRIPYPWFNEILLEVSKEFPEII